MQSISWNDICIWFYQNFRGNSRDYFQKRVLNILLADIDPQPAYTCLKLNIETLEQGVKYVQS